MPPVVSHSRTSSIALPTYSSARFKRRFKGILSGVLLCCLLIWIGIVRHRSSEEEDRAEYRQGTKSLYRHFASNLSAKKVELVDVRFEGKDGRVEESEEEEEELSRIDTEEVPLASLPFCRKTFLFRFAGLHGQGSELNLLIRLSSLSTHFGYTFLLDSTSWNYGPFSSYFRPLPPTLPLPFPSNGAPSLRCRPPGPSTRRVKVKLTEEDLSSLTTTEDGKWNPGWTEAKHVVWGPTRDMDGLDSTILSLFSNSTQLSELHKQDSEGLERKRLGGGEELGGLNELESLPDVFGEAFEKLSDEVKRVWKVNEVIEGLVEEAEERLGLSKRRDEEEEVEKKVGDLVVGVHVRLGDKYLEADRIGPQATLLSNDSTPLPNSTPSPYSSSYTAQPGLHESTITNYLAAAIESINNILSLSPSSALDPATTSSTRQEQIEYLMRLSEEWASEKEEERPTLILMSDDEGAVSQFLKHPLAVRFRVVGTAVEVERDSSDSEDSLLVKKKRMARVVKSKKEKRQLRNKGIGGHGRNGREHGSQRGHWAVAHKDKKPDGLVVPIVPAGFNENTFNAMPLEERIAQSRLFVRDVTLLSTRADALVITGSSNVGRLMSLLMGDRARGRVRSLDIRWFPTAKFA